ncbi:hypothetical protein GCM10025868_45630 [Angustibacter aerolatus]|uniref:Transcription regulator AsnC/Lrp ligand binding domain-containing protein n=1 Tax=Angustibacter aerolatus TaxID=1162965 RepID=A0ABQ6JPJ8_9ACTN|nr:Lrp/AsnC ligand binding domain-containing protein [Angustibacter aerolatus]GMA89313.1 hypothetical protein GCM10025868_45630 [Angustibacter aerolatus]
MEETDREIVRLLAADGRMSLHRPGARHRPVDVRRAPAGAPARAAGVIAGYAAVVSAEQVGLPLTAFISVTPLDPAAPDDAATRLAEPPEIEACHSVAGEESYILKVRVAAPGALEDLLARVRAVANVRTRTTVVLSTPYENRPRRSDAHPLPRRRRPHPGRPVRDGGARRRRHDRLGRVGRRGRRPRRRGRRGRRAWTARWSPPPSSTHTPT